MVTTALPLRPVMVTTCDGFCAVPPQARPAIASASSAALLRRREPFTTPNTTDTATWLPSAPSNHIVEKVSILGDTWPGGESDIVSDRWVQFSAAPASGKSWTLDQITVWSGAAGGSNLGYKVYYSTAPDFSNSTLLLDSSSNAKDTMVFQTLPTTVTLGAGQTLYLRFFPWLRSTAASGKYLCLQSLVIHGTAQ